MNLLLCFTIFMLLLANVLIGKKLLFPGTIVCAAFFMGSLLVVLNTAVWNYEISLKTYFVIVLSLMLFSMGTLFGEEIAKKYYTSQFTLNDSSQHFISKRYTNLISIIAIVVDGIYFVHQYQLAMKLGNTGGVLGMFGIIRKMLKIETEMYALSIPLNIGISFVRAAGYVCLYLLISSIVTRDKDTAKRYILPVIGLVLCEIISTSRIGIIVFAVAILFDIYIIRRKNGKYANSKLIKYCIRAFILFFIAFYLLGKLTGQSDVYSAWETISIYGGSSIVCLDDFICSFWSKPDVFAQYSFKGINSLLRRFGFAIPTYSNHFPNVYFGSYGANIYTALFPFIYDFGIVPGVLFQLFLGLFFGYMWRQFNLKSGKSVLMVVYGRFFGYALCMYSIAERLCSEFIALNVFMELLFYYVILHYLVITVCSNTIADGNQVIKS